MSDALYHGSRFRTFNIMDDFNREALAIEIDMSLRTERIIRVLDRLKVERDLPHLIRVDNGPEFLAQRLQEWGKANRVLIYHIQLGHPTQNAFIERFNRTYRNEVLNHYLFRSLEAVREITAQWMIIYNEHRPHPRGPARRSPVYLSQTNARTLYVRTVRLTGELTFGCEFLLPGLFEILESPEPLQALDFQPSTSVICRVRCRGQRSREWERG